MCSWTASNTKNAKEKANRATNTRAGKVWRRRARKKKRRACNFMGRPRFGKLMVRRSWRTCFRSASCNTKRRAVALQDSRPFARASPRSLNGAVDACSRAGGAPNAGRRFARAATAAGESDSTATSSWNCLGACLDRSRTPNSIPPNSNRVVCRAFERVHRLLGKLQGSRNEVVPRTVGANLGVRRSHRQHLRTMFSVRRRAHDTTAPVRALRGRTGADVRSVREVRARRRAALGSRGGVSQERLDALVTGAITWIVAACSTCADGM